MESFSSDWLAWTRLVFGELDSIGRYKILWHFRAWMRIDGKHLTEFDT
jgi:hypothetical protein